LMLILFTEIFIVINDCAVTTIFTISFFQVAVCQPFHLINEYVSK